MSGRSLVLACLFCLLAASAKAGEPGTTGASFLQIGAGPRAIAMGEAQTAVADDAYAGYWNPAGLSRLKYPEAALMHNQMGQGISQQYLTYVHPVGVGQALAGSLTRQTMGTIDSYDANGASRGTVAAADMAAALSYSRLLSLTAAHAPEVRLGVTGRYIQEKLAYASASTFAGDFGVMVDRLDNVFGAKARGYRLGLAVRHAGPGLKFHSDRTPLPRNQSVGLAWDGRPWGDPMTIAFDYKIPVDDDSSASFGAEYWVRRMLALRVGYITGQSQGLGLRFGVGVRLKRVLIEYALAGFGGLGDMHRFGFSFRFGGAPDVQERSAQDFIARGKDYLQQKRYYEAVTEFNRALEIDPANRSALESMREALKGMEKPAPAPLPTPVQEKTNAPH